MLSFPGRLCVYVLCTYVNIRTIWYNRHTDWIRRMLNYTNQVSNEVSNKFNEWCCTYKLKVICTYKTKYTKYLQGCVKHDNFLMHYHKKTVSRRMNKDIVGKFPKCGAVTTPLFCERRSGHRAMTRVGAPVPPRMFMGSAIIVVPLGGTWRKFFTISSPQMLALRIAWWTG